MRRTRTKGGTRSSQAFAGGRAARWAAAGSPSSPASPHHSAAPPGPGCSGTGNGPVVWGGAFPRAVLGRASVRGRAGCRHVGTAPRPALRVAAAAASACTRCASPDLRRPPLPLLLPCAQVRSGGGGPERGHRDIAAGGRRAGTRSPP